MRNILITGAIVAGLGTFMAQMADKMTPAPASATTASSKVAPVETPMQAAGRSINIPRDPRGHFQVDGRIDGQRIAFMVDTGASVVALNETSAARFGLRPPPGEYKATLSTANGTVKAARARLPMVDLAVIHVRYPTPPVIPPQPLSQN